MQDKLIFRKVVIRAYTQIDKLFNRIKCGTIFVDNSENSLLALLGGLISPIFKPLGFADWRISTALITGFTAKESVVSTLNVLLQNGDITTLFTTTSAFVFLVFSLLYTPCIAAISAVKRELGGLKAVGVVVLQCLIAWIVAFIVKLIITII